MVLRLRIFTRFLKQQCWHDVHCLNCNCLQWLVLNSKFQETSYFFDIRFLRRTTWYQKQVSFPTYDLFVCIVQTLFEYCSTEIVPEVRFVAPISVGAVAATLVISRYYVVTVINRSIRTDVVFSVSLSARTQMLQ